MRLTINVNGKDVFVSDVIHFMRMLSFYGHTDFAPVTGTVVVIHAETESQRVTERTVITEEEDDEE